MEIKIDDLSGPEIAQLLREHLENMAENSPPESRHALRLEQLCQRDITFWTVWDGAELLGCGALKELNREHGEIKSMRTAEAHLRKGVAKALLQTIISQAQQRGYTRLSLETGTAPAFKPAQHLYTHFGFTYCPPFANYVLDPYSVFMTKEMI